MPRHKKADFKTNAKFYYYLFCSAHFSIAPSELHLHYYYINSPSIKRFKRVQCRHWNCPPSHLQCCNLKGLAYSVMIVLDRETKGNPKLLFDTEPDYKKANREPTEGPTQSSSTLDVYALVCVTWLRARLSRQAVMICSFRHKLPQFRRSRCCSDLKSIPKPTSQVNNILSKYAPIEKRRCLLNATTLTRWTEEEYLRSVPVRHFPLPGISTLCWYISCSPCEPGVKLTAVWLIQYTAFSTPSV